MKDYKNSLKDFIFNNGRNCASYEDGLIVNKFIEKVKKK